jgi:hypothetical protein
MIRSNLAFDPGANDLPVNIREVEMPAQDRQPPAASCSVIQLRMSTTAIFSKYFFPLAC